MKVYLKVFSKKSLAYLNTIDIGEDFGTEVITFDIPIMFVTKITIEKEKEPK